MLIDANVLLRVLDGPEHPQHPRAIEMLRDAIAMGGSLRVLPGTIIEVAFALSSEAAGYGYGHGLIAEHLNTLLDDPRFAVDSEDVWRRAVDLYERYPIDLDDLFLAAIAEQSGERVLSFDGDFDRLRRDGLKI